MSAGPRVHVESEGTIRYLTLDRPEARNALTNAMCVEMFEALRRLEEDRDARVLVIRGAGKVFCSGADIADISGPGGSMFLPEFEHMLDELARHPLPTVCVIQGAALGAGLQLATVCDFRIAGSDAQIGIPSAKLGVMVSFENTERLVLLVGVARAKEILMGARSFSGEEAAAIGLVSSHVPAEELDGAGRELAHEISKLAPLSVRGAKRAIGVVTDHLGAARATRRMDASDIDRLVAAAHASGDLAEGVRAMKEKRPPDFTGK